MCRGIALAVFLEQSLWGVSPNCEGHGLKITPGGLSWLKLSSRAGVGLRRSRLRGLSTNAQGNGLFRKLTAFLGWRF